MGPFPLLLALLSNHVFLIAFIVVCRSIEERIFVSLVLETFWD